MRKEKCEYLREDMMKPHVDINQPPLRREDMLNPQVDINQPPLRREDMIYTAFEKEKTIHKRR